MSGTNTIADAQPSVELDVPAKMNKIKAAVRMLTPTKSRHFHFAVACSGLSVVFVVCGGMMKTHARATGTATMATNQNTQW